MEGLYKGDAVAVVSGGLDRGARLLGNGELTAEADLARFGWTGAHAKLHLLSVHGGDPNNLAGTMQGIDNIEAAPDRTKVYEIWLEQSFAGDRAALLVGMADLNADFYQNDAAGLLIAPAFGIGSELASTGPNGPSIFPSTALAARLRVSPSENSYVKAALFNAKAGVLGDRGGVDLKMRDGALAIAEAGIAADGKLALGYWRYTERQPDIRLVDAAGDPRRDVAQGVYLLAEKRLAGSGEAGRQVNGFVRLGLSDGDTTPYRAGWQAGILVDGVFAGREGTQLSFGVNQAYLSRKYRLNGRDAGTPWGHAETGFELTYSHPLSPYLTVQPDVQYILNPSADPSIRDAVIVGARFTVTVPGS
ncbi:porin [Sphingomonas parva]|uniref:Porin n=1 Tax=Sphingomonas parva TaxID=2555898 RepID=A0A4Y8ZVY8_9SPHN|nr:porin [Sphingomonas parva]